MRSSPARSTSRPSTSRTRLCPAARPVRELKAFAKVDLDPGEATVVDFALTARDLSYWSTKLNGWALEGGEFELTGGALRAID
jgi:hypothetical protein